MMPVIVDLLSSSGGNSTEFGSKLTTATSDDLATIFYTDFSTDGYYDTTQVYERDTIRSNATSVSPVPQYNIRCVNECDQKQFIISYVIITLALIALVENLTLLIAVAKLKLGTKCKMLAFLWHFTFANTIISLQYVYYHSRTIAVCPRIYTCHPQYTWEMFLNQTSFTTCLLSSYVFVLAATVDRYIAIRWSLRYTSFVTTRRVRICSGLIWTFTIALSIMGTFLMIFWDKRKGHSVLAITVAVLCVVAAAGVIILNIANVCYAWSSINRGIHKDSCLRRSQYQIEQLSTISRELSARENVFSNTLHLTEIQKQNRKLAVTLVMFVAAFLVSCTPWPLTLLICKNISSCQIKQSNVYILVLVVVHAILMPIIYGFRIEDVNQTVRTSFRNMCGIMMRPMKHSRTPGT